jgi:hypothetical protein
MTGCLDNKKNETSCSVNAGATASLNDGSEVLMTIDGQPKITLNSLNAQFDRLLDENPQLKQVLPLMPEAKANFLQGMANQEIVDHWVKQTGVADSTAYQQEFEQTMEQVKKMLNSKYFSDKHPVSVSASEVKAFYEENKSKSPELMLSQGGVKAEGVSFKDEAEAKAFLAKAGAKGDLNKLASDAGFAENYRDFKMVNSQSLAIDPALRAKLMSFTTFPTVELVQAGDMWWVVKAESKEEPQYRPFEQIKPSIEDYLKKQKQMEVFEKAIDGYKKQYNVEINDAPLKGGPVDENAMQRLQQMMAEQEEAELAANDESSMPVRMMQAV